MSNTQGCAIGALSSYTEDGPPERIMPFKLRLLIASREALGEISSQ